MSAKTQFPFWKIGIILICSFSFLSIGFSKEKSDRKETNFQLPKSILAEPQLVGPDDLCIIFGQVLGTFSAGGDPGDVYTWSVIDPSGNVIFEDTAGDQLESIDVVFSTPGNYTVRLQVRRGTNSSYFEDSKVVTVLNGPDLELKPDYLLCAGSSTLLRALDPTTPSLNQYTIEWNDIDGNLLGTGNEFSTTSEGFYLVEIARNSGGGESGCIINASTFVGPPVDFEIIPSAETICEGESIQFGLDTPLSGDWLIQKGLTGARSIVSSGFDISLDADNLSGPGRYFITFQTTTEEFPDCISERTIEFELLEAPQVDTVILEEPDDCLASNGEFQLTINSDVEEFSIPELNFSQGPIVAGQQFNFSNLDPNIYSIILTQSGCQTATLVSLDSKDPPVTPNPPDQNRPSIRVSSESCGSNGTILGSAEIDFGNNIPDGIFRLMSSEKGEVQSGNIPADGLLELELSSGTYLLLVIVEGCSYPVETFTVDKSPQVNFTVPESLNICESFELEADTEQTLQFILSYPDGSEETLNSGQPFSLTEAGTYSIIGEGVGSDANLCPKTHTFTATFSSTISFEPVLAIEECFDPIKYEIDAQGVDIEDASIRWYNDQGEIVGRAKEFFPSSLGYYSLLVQPLESGFCPVDPVEFEVVAPIIPVSMELIASKICPDPEFGLITLEIEEDLVQTTEWIFYDSLDNRQELVEFDGLFEIEVNLPGTYEVVAYNELGCEIGRNLIEVERSTLLSPPQLEDRYAICSKENTLPGIDPGEFATYEWYFDDVLVSTSSIYKPTQVGNYQLLVTTEDGCSFSDTFTTFDACDFKVIFPNAMILGDPNRDFRVVVSEGVSDAQLFILNRQGALIHEAQTTEIAPNTPILNWDGTLQNGELIPLGTYAVVLVLRNPIYGFEEKITGLLIVIQ
ncbi:hypothetical protein [Algoriphagus hitonicola]|uniref:C-terminal domain of CHU protein family protein n=1 Tax=Algoriphagus hitonicola TaxID=435880 RepID=A0A1I2VB17_9BACT|nr:hypothetical protein [Algoriphagus hitonicola]SFG84321.1 hypothetical protein SAMN04487988_1096 [Algoriphagus hitonicola]